MIATKKGLGFLGNPRPPIKQERTLINQHDTIITSKER